eukprot:TRINITY_DN108961_c0_g1_i1.p1 TRINITY_DN108961_c0_g1~~TRINITY_DN108961_c0_g1_i1.p1  ORF type:complete len:613 (+),score=120.02 TRINITY_DN108961_c0_g1_i1:26-1864(+)
MALACSLPVKSSCHTCPLDDSASCPPPLRERQSAYQPHNYMLADLTGLPVEEQVAPSRHSGSSRRSKGGSRLEEPVLIELQGLRAGQKHLEAGQCRLEASMSALLEQQRLMLEGGAVMEAKSVKNDNFCAENVTTSSRPSKQLDTALWAVLPPADDGSAKTQASVRPSCSNGSTSAQPVANGYKSSGSNASAAEVTNALGFSEEDKISKVDDRSLWLKRCIKSQRFDTISAAILLSNSIFIGVQVEYGFQHSVPLAIDVIDWVFCGLFNLELWLRLWAYGCNQFWCTPGDRAWNMFDFFIVMVSTADAVISVSAKSEDSPLGNVSILRVVRIIRVLRVLRIIRIMKFFQDLRLLLMAIGSTVKTASFAFMLIMGVMYVFGIAITQMVAEHMKERQLAGSPVAADDDLTFFFGGVWRSIYCLFMAIAGGIDWKDAAVPLSDVGPIALTLFLVYVTIMLLCIMNVLLGIFCQSALDTAAKDEENVIRLQLQEKSRFADTLKKLFDGWDDNTNGRICFEEFRRHLQDEPTQALLRSLEIESHDAILLFDMMDSNGSGDVDLEEFIHGCITLRGGAKAIHMEKISSMNKHLLDRVTALEAGTARISESSSQLRSSQ